MSVPSALLARPENQILLMCARGTTPSKDFGTALSKVEDWKTLTSQLHSHRLTLLFLHHVRGHEQQVPKDVLQEIEEIGEKILHWNLFLLTELQQVTRTLTQQGIRVLAYKGPSIAYIAYGTLALRRFVDLDLLVSPRERGRAISVLQSTGFRQVLKKTALTPYFRLPKKRAEYEAHLQSKSGQTLVDLHWAITAPFESFPLQFEEMWKRRVPVEPLGEVYTLCREDLIVSLCFHGLKHMWEEIEWVGCLLNLLQSKGSKPLNWKHIEKSVRAVGCERVLYLGLRLVLDLVEIEKREGATGVLPSEIQRRVDNDTAVEQMARFIWKRNLEKEDSSSNHYSKLLQHSSSQTYLGVWARQGWNTQGRYLGGTIQNALLSLDQSKLALKLTQPLLKLCEALFGRPSNAHSL